MASIIESLTSGLDFLKYLNPFDENFILKNVLDFLGNILSYINPFDENFFGYKLIELLGDLLETLFIPKEESFTDLKDVFNEKFAFIDSIKIGIEGLLDVINNVGESPSLSVDVAATKYTEAQKLKIIDMSWYKPYKAYSDVILTVLIYVFFLWRLYIKLPNIISGYGGTVDNVMDFIIKR